MKITKTFLKKIGACPPGYQWFCKYTGDKNHESVIDALIADDHGDWANWLIVRCMTHEQQVQYTIFAAEQVIHIFEGCFPDDNRPRKAIETVKAFIVNPSGENKRAAALTVADAAHAALAAAVTAHVIRTAYAADATHASTLLVIIRYGLQLLRS